MTEDVRHLTAEEVATILAIVQDTDAVVVGGQSVNIWANHYARRDPGLAERGPFTSKDIDFYGAVKTAKHLANILGGQLITPSIDDQTPNSGLVVAMMGDRRIDIDFMRVVLGVDNTAIENNYMTIAGVDPVDGTPFRIMLLHPLDCLRSRYANINDLKREDELSLKQASISIDVLKYFIEELLEQDAPKDTQSTLHNLYYVARDGYGAGQLARKYEALNPIRVMKHFLENPKLDPRWREHTLGGMIARLEAKFAPKT